MEVETTAPSQSTWNKTKLVLNILTSTLIFGVTAYICYLPFTRYHYLFTWHVVTGTVAYLLLMPGSIMIFDDVWFVRFSRKHKSWIHGGLVGAATIFAIASVYLDVHRQELYKDRYPTLQHFETPHAITGLISVIILIIANISGIFTANITWFRKKVISVRPVVLKLSHNVLGQLGYVMGVISILIIVATPWFVYYITDTIQIILILLIIAMTLWSLINSFISGYSQVQILRS